LFQAPVIDGLEKTAFLDAVFWGDIFTSEVVFFNPTTLLKLI
jgi:hypothetical protein